MHASARDKFIEYLKSIAANSSYTAEKKLALKDLAYGDLNRATTILNKERIPFDFAELYFLIYQAYVKSVDPLVSKGLTVPDHICEEVISEIMATLDSYPQPYTAYVAVPSINLCDSDIMNVADGVSIVHVKDMSEFGLPEATDLAATLASVGRVPEKNTCYLKVELTGWAVEYHRGHLFADALSSIKQVVAALHVSEFAELRPENEGGFFGLSMSRFSTDPMIIHEKGKEADNKPMIYEIPYELRRALNIVTIVPTLYEADPLIALLCSGSSSMTKPAIVAEKMKYLYKVLSIENDDTRRVNAALHWYGECLINTNETFQFILASIALEALLGHQFKDSSITSTLADRCAYLLETTESKRQAIRANVLELYSKRSKLVHGSKSKLEKTELGSLRELKHIVKSLIRREIINSSSSVT